MGSFGKWGGAVVVAVSARRQESRMSSIPVRSAAILGLLWNSRIVVIRYCMALVHNSYRRAYTPPQPLNPAPHNTPTMPLVRAVSVCAAMGAERMRCLRHGCSLMLSGAALRESCRNRVESRACQIRQRPWCEHARALGKPETPRWAVSCVFAFRLCGHGHCGSTFWHNSMCPSMVALRGTSSSLRLVVGCPSLGFFGLVASWVDCSARREALLRSFGAVPCSGSGASRSSAHARQPFVGRCEASPKAVCLVVCRIASALLGWRYRRLQRS